jgi:hypothetical protein
MAIHNEHGLVVSCSVWNMLTTIKNVSVSRLALGILLTTIGALSVHAVMLQVLHVPFPDLSVIAAAYKFAIRAMATLGLIIFWQLALQKLPRSLAKQWAILFLMSTMLTENLFRAPFMDAYCTKAWTFIFVANISKLLTMAIAALMIVTVTPKLLRLWQKVAGALLITALTVFVLGPLIDKAMAPVMAAIAGLAPSAEWCTLPYGADVLIPAYITFLEPTLACFAAAALIWNQLSAVRVWRVAQFALLILAIKNLLVTPVVYAALAKQPFMNALVSDGQFFLEGLALAVLTGISWEWSTARKA